MEKRVIGKNLVVIAFLGLLVVVGLVSLRVFGSKPPTPPQPPTTSPPPTSPAFSPAAQETPASTANWVEYKNILEGVTLKLPPETKKPLWDNTGQYSKGTYLPKNTRLTLSLRGKNQPLSDNWENFLKELAKENFKTEQVSISGKSSTLFEGRSVASSLITMGANCAGNTSGAVIEVDTDRYLVISHTACEDFQKLYPEKEDPDFEADEDAFDSVLTTIRLES